MKTRLLLICCVIFLSACQPSAADVEKAIAQTQAAQPTATYTFTPIPTNTSTNTPAPTATKRPTSTPAPSFDDQINEIFTQMVSLIETYVSDVESVTVIRRGQESLEIELRTVWASKDRQADVSYQVMRVLSDVFVDTTESKALNFVTGKPEHFSISLITFSTDGDYEYSSLTYFDTLKKLHNKQITYEEWLAEAKAGFIN